MLTEDNAPGRFQDRKITEQEANRPKGGEPAGQDLGAPAQTAEKSIDVVFDLEDPKQAESLERHRDAFGRDHHEVEELGEGTVVLKIYPGGARRLP
jgi:hypothetical protein